MGTAMTVCLIGSLPNEGLTPERAASRQYRMINGNHRLAALLLLEKELPAGSTQTTIAVDVHVGMTIDVEKHVAFCKCVVCVSV